MAWINAITEKKRKSDISYTPGSLWNEVIDFTDDPVVQCDVKNTSLDDDDDNDDHK